MPLERQLGSSIAGPVRSLLDGDFAAAGVVADWLQEHRPEDLPHFRMLVGHLAAGTFARGASVDETASRSVRASDWEDFRHGLTALFWFELYTPDSTYAALSAACERMKADPPKFGFPGVNPR